MVKTLRNLVFVVLMSVVIWSKVEAAQAVPGCWEAIEPQYAQADCFPENSAQWCWDFFAWCSNYCDQQSGGYQEPFGWTDCFSWDNPCTGYCECGPGPACPEPSVA